MSVLPYVSSSVRHTLGFQVISQKALLKVRWYVLRVKNMHFWSPSDSCDQCGKAEPSYVQYIIRPGEAKLRILERTIVFHHLSTVGPKQLCALNHLGCTRKAVTS